ncbi:septum formation initiator family protein [bacterium]|nr:septum formation initiator family protein [bacterium]
MRKKRLKNLYKDDSIQNVLISLILGVLFLIIIIFLVFSNLKMNKRRAELNERISELKKEIELLQERNDQLKASVEGIGDSEYAEKILREKGLYKKKGEKVIVVLPSEEKTIQLEEKEKEGIWNVILKKLHLRD